MWSRRYRKHARRWIARNARAHRYAVSEGISTPEARHILSEFGRMAWANLQCWIGW